MTPSTATALFGARLFSSADDRTTWTTLTRGALTDNTWTSYDGKFGAFHTFCEQHGLRSLPASQTTVLRYVMHLYREDRVHGSSIQPYLSAINRVHRDLNLPAPADGHLVATAKRGFVRLHERAPVSRPGDVSAPTRSIRSPVPAALAFRALQHGLATSDDFVRICCAVVIHAFLFAARASSVVGVPVSAYVFDSSQSLTFREDARKTGGPSRVMRVPFISASAHTPHPLVLLHRHYQRRLHDCARRGTSPDRIALFAHPQLPRSSASVFVSAALDVVLRAVDFTVPPGVSFSSHSLRSGAATAAIAAGASLPAVMAWCGWKSMSSAQRYIDPTAHASDAASLFFSFLRPDSATH